jgi:hypothetical protein
MGRQIKRESMSRGKGHNEQMLRSHYGLAKKAARSFNQNPNPKMEAAIKGILQSTHKYLREINKERALHYKKPLTMEELIEIIRESE